MNAFGGLAAVLALGAAAAALPVAASASCEPRGKPAYTDVVAVNALRFSLAQTVPKPAFALYVGRFDLRLDRKPGPRFDTTLTIFKNGPLPRGAYKASDQEAAFKSVVAVLEKYDFFSIHLVPAKAPYIDGPDDYVAATRCGVLYSVGVGGPVTGKYVGDMLRQVDLNDAQFARLSKMLDEIQALTFSAQWKGDPAASASPSPAPK